MCFLNFALSTSRCTGCMSCVYFYAKVLGLLASEICPLALSVRKTELLIFVVFWRPDKAAAWPGQKVHLSPSRQIWWLAPSKFGEGVTLSGLDVHVSGNRNKTMPRGRRRYVSDVDGCHKPVFFWSVKWVVCKRASHLPSPRPLMFSPIRSFLFLTEYIPPSMHKLNSKWMLGMEPPHSMHYIPFFFFSFFWTSGFILKTF